MMAQRVSIGSEGHRRRLALAAMTLVFFGCSSNDAAPDSSTSDAGGGSPSSPSDGGSGSDAGTPDGGAGSVALPAGVTLRAIDGGPAFFAKNGFTKATAFPTKLAGGWDNPGFFPLGSFLGALRTDTVGDWNDLGWTCGFSVDGSFDLAVARANDISVLADFNSSGFGAETVGLDAADEPSDYATLSSGIEKVANPDQAGRFWWLNVTWNQLVYGNVQNTPGSKYSDMYLTPITMPGGGTNVFHAASNDLYFFNGGTADFWLGAGGHLYDTNGALTADQMRRGFLYGDYIDAQRAELGINADGSGTVPVFGLVETGGSYTEDTTAASYIQPAELNQAVWMSIIHGARGIIYFDHTFAGPAQSDNDVFDTYYKTASNFPNTGNYANPNGLSMHAQVKATDALVAELAPVIAAPFAIGYLTVTPQPVSCAVPCTSSGASVFSTIGIDTATKWYSGGGALANGAYVLASPRASEKTTNIDATFTVADTAATKAVVVGESREIAIDATTHRFVDTFATGLTVHIYRIE